ncbi:hypothetical protein ACFQE1_03490 [Halobium palmae]|uniref:Uncharacterized protein n=1 Tax=Halobium palmae TaxID=1776492 RepID=A0ABD5RW57_9EURY
MPQPNFHFGEVRNGIPEGIELSNLESENEHNHFPEELAEERGDNVLRRGSRFPYHEDGTDEDYEEYFYYRYTSEVVQSGVRLNDEGEDDEFNTLARDTMEFILLGDGRFIYESSTDIGPGNALEVLFGEIPDYESDMSITTSILRDYYDDHDQIGEVTVGGIDATGVGSSGTDLRRAVVEAGRISDKITFNTGTDREANLKESTLIDEFVSLGEVSQITVTNSGENNKELSDNNWVSFYYPEALEPRARSRLIYKRVKPILDVVNPV